MKQMRFAATALGAKKAPGKHPRFAASAEKNQWARQVPGNGSARARNFFSVIDRRWVHFGYVVIDVAVVSFNCLLQFYLLSAPPSFVHTLYRGGLKLTGDLPLRPYFGYLLVYAILVVLVC